MIKTEVNCKWFIYYEDGTVVDDSCEVEEVRTVGVQVILWRDYSNNRWKVIEGFDYYLWKHHRWFGSDLGGLMLYLLYPGWKKVLFGSWIPKEQYTEIQNKALSHRQELMSGCA